jgi:hypothetical protein
VIPGAVRAVIAAVIQEHPGASPDLLSRLIVAELKDLGWHITAVAPAQRQHCTA